LKTIGPLIADSGKVSLGYAKRLIVGISPSQFGRFATGSSGEIVSNHPAFVYGHLSLYACRIVEQLGKDASSIKPSELYTERFNHTANCIDDADGTLYPPMDELVEKVVTGYEAAIDALNDADDSLFTIPNVNEAMRSKFATNGSMQAFYIGGHFMYHMGQVSAWRRMIGLGQA
jgi:hypothetical protein